MKKSYKVGRVPSTYRKTETPMVTLGGLWLKDMGFEVGNEFQVINGKNMLILMKIPTKEVQERHKKVELENLINSINEKLGFKELRIEELEQKYKIK